MPEGRHAASAPPGRALQAAPQPDSSTPGPAWRWQMLIAVLLTAGGAATTMYLARQWWFHADAWDFLTSRSFAEPATLLRPHGSHWQTPTVLLYRVLYAAAGMDFYPWYLLPRVIGWALLSFWTWRVVVRRQTAWHTALASLALVLVLGASNWQDASTVGNVIVLAIAYNAALLVAERDSPTSRDAWLLAGLLALALMSSSLGLAVAAAALVTIAWLPNRRLWLGPVLAALAVYGVWYLAFRFGNPQGAPTHFEELVRAPQVFLTVLGNAIRILAGIPLALGVVLAVLVTLSLVWSGARGRLDSFDVLLILASVIFIAMLTAVRLASGTGEASAARYAQNVTMLLFPVVIPKIAHRRFGPSVWLVTLALLAAVPANVAFLSRGIDFWERRAQASRVVVETAASLRAQGEPAVSSGALDGRRAGVLTVERLDELVDDGWDPKPSTDPVGVAAARANLRFDLRPRDAPVGLPLRTRAALGASGCVTLAEGERLVAFASDVGSLRIERQGETTITMRWFDEFGTGRLTRSLDSNVSTLIVAEPLTIAEVRLIVEEGQIAVCGLEADTG